MTDYVQALRSIGQALELLRAEDFDLEIEDEAFLVRCSVPRPKEMIAGQAEQAGLLQHIWGVLPVETRMELNMTLTGQFKVNEIDLHYALKDVDRLDEEGRAKRGGTEESNAPTLSQFLRIVAAHVKQKPARLRRISRKDDSIAVQYETPSGEINKEVLSMADLYELGVWMSMRRTDLREK
ncbi:MAG: hypothetical protein ACM3TN_03085 [Alphaproteobacteria bacterium]